MNMISRGEFLKLGSLSLLGTFASELVMANDLFIDNSAKVDSLLMNKLLFNNDAKVKSLIDSRPLDLNTRITGYGYRPIATNIAILVASFSYSKSEFYQSNVLLDFLNHFTDVLLKAQHKDGTLDAGGNKQSPPDTAFVLESMCLAATVLKNSKQNKVLALKAKIQSFIQNGGEGLVTGGVHTPNHRWVVCAALASINSLYPDDRYINRINQWLAEGIYISKDGQYSERSGVYSAVINKALITMARLLNKPDLLTIVHKNLSTYYYYTESNGDLVTVDSRRQDQFQNQTVTKFYLQYRFMAIHTGDPKFIYMTNLIEKNPDFTQSILSDSLVAFLEEASLQKQLPSQSLLNHDYEMFFATSSLARIKRGKTAITLFGGNDKPLLVVSGRSSNPNFLMYRKGEVVLNYMRLSSSFFRMGYFSSDGIEKKGNKYVLKETKQADYYQPLSSEYIKSDADYTLSESKDGRFWNKMDFEHREVSNVKKQTTVIEIEEINGQLTLDFKVDGPPNVEITIEMCFNEGTQIEGATLANKGNYFLKSNEAKLLMGSDQLLIGPGLIEHENVNNLDSEVYSYHKGTLRTEGVHVYITGFTPFHHKMTLG